VHPQLDLKTKKWKKEILLTEDAKIVQG